MMRLSFRAFGAAGALALLCAGEALAQGTPVPPPPGRREIPNLDISPDGGWRGKAQRVRASRRASLARGDVRALNAPGMAQVVTGNFVVPIVFIAYSDTTVVQGVTPVVGDTGLYRALFLSATPGAEATPRPYSLKTYYEQLSNNNITFDGDIFGWINTPFTYANIGNNCAAVFCSGFQAKFGAMLRAALDSLNSATLQVDWGQFDNDGPDGNPNSGDDDGLVDFVTFVHPTLGGECGGAGGGQTGNRIWAHRWTLASVSGSQYVTKTARTGGGFIRINDYTVQSGRGGASSCTASQIMPIGTVAHETGHAFGIPDLYATAGLSEGVGEWSLMGSGNYTRPPSPAAWDAWSLLEVGWLKVDTLSTSRNVTLRPVQSGDTVLVARITATDEYFIFENRARLQSDTANMNASLGTRQKSPGLLVWHIDQSVVDGGRAANTVNAGTVEGVHLVQADGLEELHNGVNRGNAGDAYPGTSNNRKLTYHSNPAMTANDGTVAGFVIDSILQPIDTGSITFRFRRSAPFRVTSTQLVAGGLVTVNGVLNGFYEDLFGIGDTIAVSVADTQLVNSGRTQLAFVSWSDAGGRTHNIISDGTPDTVVATLSARFRVNFTANGSGTIGTSGPANNTFVNSGSAVTLTATPTGGATFTNWTGDTTTNNATLILPMGKPYNVVANFTGAVAITYDQATNAILGLAALTGPQSTYLDAIGNNNAVYDLGDYLAYLKANGFVLSPQVLKRAQLVHPVVTTKER